jgi:putative hemolysin
MASLIKTEYVARLANKPADIAATQRFRYKAFGLSDGTGLDSDKFDHGCEHFLIESRKSGELVCCFRIMHMQGGSEIEKSYSAQYYELSALHAYHGKTVEMGRFCVDPDVMDADVLRVAWGAVTRHVDAEGVDLLFGCTSFQGTDASAYYDAFAMLRDKHFAPKRWLPRAKAPKVFRFAARLRRKPDMKRAMRGLPPLLKTYLMMGGWVSDHAVVDRHMNTLHVFTGVEIGRIPPARKRILRALA